MIAARGQPTGELHRAPFSMHLPANAAHPRFSRVPILADQRNMATISARLSGLRSPGVRGRQLPGDLRSMPPGVWSEEAGAVAAGIRRVLRGEAFPRSRSSIPTILPAVCSGTASLSRCCATPLAGVAAVTHLMSTPPRPDLEAEERNRKDADTASPWTPLH